MSPVKRIELGHPYRPLGNACLWPHTHKDHYAGKVSQYEICKPPEIQEAPQGDFVVLLS